MIDCGDSADLIEAALRRALDPTFVAEARNAPDPYYRPDTPARAVEAIRNLKKDTKKFYDLPAK